MKPHERRPARQLRILLVIFCCSSLQALSETKTLAERAEAHFNAGQWSESIEHYTALTEAQPDDATFQYRLGRSFVGLKAYKSALTPLETALKHRTDIPEGPILFALARSTAALKQEDRAVAYLEQIVAIGGRPYTRVINSEEFNNLRGTPAFESVLMQLRPCGDDERRAFDFWIGEWQVTTPARAGWVATSSITVGNDGCSIHESYQTPGGYAGTSVNFYNPETMKWHQTWIDNQGSPLFLAGGLVDNAMQLTDGTNRITWSIQPDESVRQHWETTPDDGNSWNTIFDGYYRKPVVIDIKALPNE